MVNELVSLRLRMVLKVRLLRYSKECHSFYNVVIPFRIINTFISVSFKGVNVKKSAAAKKNYCWIMDYPW